jgi:hypothetical protein
LTNRAGKRDLVLLPVLDSDLELTAVLALAGSQLAVALWPKPELLVHLFHFEVTMGVLKKTQTSPSL